MRKLGLLLLLLVGLLPAIAQNQKITGRVLNASGQPVEGATVTVKGTRNGVTTNSKGEFAVNAGNGTTLVVSSIGYTAKEVQVDGSAMTISLSESNAALADVVVVGYGAQRRSKLTSAVATVRGEDLVKRPVSTTSMALQGFAPGLVVQQTTGQPGIDAGVLNIRGVNSISQTSAPLVVIDGVEGANMNDLDPNMIENVSVLKDAAATAVYGVRGTNGVILIKTKRGQSGRTNISYNGFVSKQSPTNFPELLSSVDHMQLMNESFVNAGAAAPFTQAQIDQYRTQPADNLNVFNTDWRGLIFQNSGLMQNHNVIVSGGSERVNYVLSGTLFDQQGLVVNNRFKRYDLRMNSDVKVTNRITFSTDFFYTNATNIQPAGMSPNEIIARGISMARLFPGKFADGQYGDAGQTNRINPVAAAENSGINRANTPTLSMRFALKFEPIRNLFLEAAYNTRTSNTEAYAARTAYPIFNPNPATNSYVFAQMVGDSLLSYNYNRFYSNQYYGSGTYNFNLNRDHHFKVQAGFQAVDNRSTSVSASRAGLPDPTRPFLNLATIATSDRVSGSGSETAVAGFFGRLNYDFQDKYLLEVSGRRDGTSRFFRNRDLQWQNFWAVSGGWVFSKEKFMQSAGFINFAKLRASYGVTGNEQFDNPYPFAAQLNNGTAYYFNNQLTQGSSLQGLANEFLTWEKSRQAGVGIDVTMLRNKLSFSFDLYEKKVSDMLIDIPVPFYLGFGSTSDIPKNGATMVNRGFEFTTTYRNNIGKLNYSVTANLSDVRNEVLSIEGPDVVRGVFVTRPGHSINSYFLLRTNGLYQTGDNFSRPFNPNRTTGPGDVKYVDADGNDTINLRDRVLMGNNFPRYDYSLNLNVDYKGFDLNIFLFGVGKRDNYISGVAVQPFAAANWIASGLTSALDRWTSSKTDARYPRLFNGGNGNYLPSDFWLRNGAFMRVRHITLGYTLPANFVRKAGIQSLRFYVNVVNPFTFSDYEPGFDPEQQNVTGFLYPIMKTYTAGVNLKF